MFSIFLKTTPPKSNPKFIPLTRMEQTKSTLPFVTFGYQFAPRYQDIYDKVSTSLYGFKHPSQYGDLRISPIRKIHDNLIISEWENIQRIMVSLAMISTTQSIIVSKLNAYTRKNKTRRALWEYDNIIQSLYLLDYVDSPPLRQNVQRALNRGENYLKLR